MSIMAREALIRIYLFSISMLFFLFNLFPLRNKAVFVTSFGDNCEFILNEMDRQQIGWKRVILKTANSRIRRKVDGQTIVLPFESGNIVHFVRSVYHLATARRIIIDNYFGFLSSARFRKEAVCVQVWHAAGAIKQFGLKDPGNADRTPAANRRFLRVYSRFHYIAAGSRQMAAIFKESFGAEDKQILATGVPRTDFFFDPEALAKAREQILNSYPDWDSRKTILYAPTFRSGSLTSGKIALDIDRLYKELGSDGYILLLKLHPAVKAEAELETAYPGFVYNLSGFRDINQLLPAADILVTDYSSIPFEYAFLGKPMYFFAYDLEDYKKERGFWEAYTDSMPGPVSYTTEQLASQIKAGQFDAGQIEAFKEKWNEYSRGDASARLVSFLFNQENRIQRQN